MSDPAAGSAAVPLVIPSVLDELDMGVVIVDDARRIVVWNTWMVRHSGISRRTAIGAELSALLPAMAGGRVELAVRDALDTGLPAVISHHVNHDLFPLLRGDGMTDERVAQSIVVRPTRTGRGVGCLIQIYDQTAAVERERKLRAQRSARYHAIVDAARDCFVTVDEDGAIWSMNPATEERFGCSAAAMRGQPIARLLPQLQDLPLLGEPLVPVRAVGAGGKAFDAEISMGSWMNNGVRHFTLFIRDVTERNLAAENLRRTERIQALGELTGGVAHEFNNLLMVIRANAEMVLAHAGGEAAAHAAEIVQAVDRGRNLTDGLLSFARRQPLNPVRVPLDAAVEDIQRLAAPLLGVAVEIAAPPILAGAAVMADRTQLQNALLNLLINARDAMPDGGRITITAGPGPEPGQCHIAVADTGTGMSPAILEKACEPFFTTKDQGKGTGLGLSMVAGFARQSGGDFLLASRPGAGTTATIRLRGTSGDGPPGAAADADGAGKEDGPPPVLPPLRLLVTEDDPQVRAGVLAMLAQGGHRTAAAADGPDALDLMADEDFDLLVTDIMLPRGMNGVALACEARRMFPRLAVVLMSGYHGFDPALLEAVGPAAILRKPFTRTDLERAMAAALRQRPRSPA
ncbi:hybrid sensor histidine kinase/response regulator [Azospirillum isscasi]|uniref:histidine kinase n=1 Tax=Azospirillum isscasi TaxID=3053926 RepID=A0ABU0WQD3_9PROT|nr:PAS domain-containing sensor histidine kinase [Azospirillum isscasi]MDQ2106391.1 ATP-binding protein [Azospirillum isscasi]